MGNHWKLCIKALIYTARQCKLRIHGLGKAAAFVRLTYFEWKMSRNHFEFRLTLKAIRMYSGISCIIRYNRKGLRDIVLFIFIVEVLY